MHQRQEKMEMDRITEELDKKGRTKLYFAQNTLQATLIRLTEILSL